MCCNSRVKGSTFLKGVLLFLLRNDLVT
uniref:Uncharacterized protein n=1 Tax=Anguilla anguilla TaxID=7936 RepID=A0A0E9UNU1_ANGAN